MKKTDQENETTPAARRIQPRKWTLAGTVAAGALVATQPLAVAGLATAITLAPAHAQTSEGGESGEAGVVLSDGPAEFLTQLGYFEGAYHIARALYLSGAHAEAAAHLDESHHAYYEDIEDQIETYGAPGFLAEADAFTKAVMDDAGEDEVASSYDALMARLAENAMASGASAYERALSVHDLVELAAAEYGGGVIDGVVEVPIEFRDSWGFYETARRRAEVFAKSDDADLAAAGASILEQLDGIEALYPSLTATTAAVDPSQLIVASGWTEIIALRLK